MVAFTPLVSIIIPCRNEEQFIGRCLDSILTNDYPQDKLEVLVVDGMSTDGTRQIIESYTHRFPWISRIDNPKQIIPAAMNLGIQHATAPVIMKMDAHSTYDPGYIGSCIKYLKEYGVDGVGGILITLPQKDTLVGQAIALSLSHAFGVGNSYFRTGASTPRYVDAVAFGCYRKELFQKIGLYNEDLVRSSDADMNVRLRGAGSRILLIPRAIAYYYAVSSLGKFWNHNFSDGFWVTYPLKFGRRIFSWRHLVPLAFVCSGIVVVALASLSSTFLWLLCALLGVYVAASGVFAVGTVWREKNIGLLFLLPIAFTMRHVAYGLGSLVGLAKVCRAQLVARDHQSYPTSR
jgi:glycosyltransferase involved in cell wall biosynthesis